MRFFKKSVADAWDHAWPLEKKLEYMGRLEENWDSYGGDPISPAAIGVARTILTDKDTHQNYIVCPMGDGGIAIYWCVDSCELTLEIEADGGYWVSMTTPGWPDKGDIAHFQMPTPHPA